jgi:hypothetical protein
MAVRLAACLVVASPCLAVGTARAEVPDSDRTGGAGRSAPVALWTPRLLIQADAVPLRHGNVPEPVLEDATADFGIYLRRARLGLDVAAGMWRARFLLVMERPEVPPLGGGLDPIAATMGGPPSLMSGLLPARPSEAFVGLSPHKAFGLWMGSMRVPLGLSRAVDEADLRLPERARIVTRATPDFRVGAKLAGDLGLLQYALGVYAPGGIDAGQSFRAAGPLTVLRLSGEPVGPVGVAPQLRRSDDPWSDWWRFSVGLSLFHARLAGDNEVGVGGDAQFQWARLCVTAEGLWTHRGANDRLGFVVEPGVFVWRDRLEVVARGEWFNDDVGPRSPVDAWGASLGMTLFTADRLARLQAAYTLRASPSFPTEPVGWAVIRLTFTR